MSRTESLERLEGILESFLDRMIERKSDRLRLLAGINRLDDIARGTGGEGDLTDRIGRWFADHRSWVEDPILRPADHNRVTSILEEIRSQMAGQTEESPATDKINREINRWKEAAPVARGRKLTLRRPPEQAPQEPIDQFEHSMERMSALFADYRQSKEHLLSVLDEALESAEKQSSREALILSATIIYYLKLQHYKVEPYVRRLKAAEQAHTGDQSHA